MAEDVSLVRLELCQECNRPQEVDLTDRQLIIALVLSVNEGREEIRNLREQIHTLTAVADKTEADVEAIREALTGTNGYYNA